MLSGGGHEGEVLCWVVFVNLTQIRVTGEEETFTRKCLHQVDLCADLWITVLIIGSCGKAQPAVGGAPPGLVGLVYMRKHHEQGQRSKPVSSLWSLLHFLP